MFGSSSPFGQSASSPFGSQPPFGQNNVTSNPFATKPFGATNPFGAQTGASIFGSTSTGVFGQSSSPLSSTPAFGATSSPGFGSSTPAFGSTSSSFGGSTAFGQKPAFGGFGSSTQTSPFGSSFQQSQPAFGSNLFGSSSPFNASSQPAFGGASSPVFGSSTTSAFGGTSAPAFGSTPTPTFGSTGTGFGVASTPAFGSGGAFGSTSTSVFGAATAPAFGANTAPGFGATPTPAFGATTAPAFGATASSPAFGATTAPAFGGSTPSFSSNSNPSFGFGTSAAFGQSTSVFGSTPFGSTPPPFGGPSSQFGAQPSTPTFGSGGFGQSTLGSQQGGTRVAQYAPTPEADSGSSSQQTAKLDSISAMQNYKDKSHEELRWEDYQRGDKGGPNPAGQSTPGMSFGASTPQSSPFGSSTFGQTSSNPFSTTAQPNLFASKTTSGGFGTIGFGTGAASAFGSSPFSGTSTSSPFGSTTAPTSSIFAASTSTSPFGSSNTPSLFGTPTSSPIGSTSLFGNMPTQGTAASFGSTLSFANTQSSPLFQSPSPSFGQTGAAFGQTGSSFGQTGGFTSNIFSASSAGLGTNMFSSTPFSTSNFAQTTPSLSTPFQPAQPTQTSSAFNFNNFGQTQSAGTGGFVVGSSIFGQNLGQLSSNQVTAVAQPVAVTNPFGTLPAMPHMSIGNTGTSPSVQYGVSSMPVVDKPTSVRISSLLTSRHLSQRRIRLPARKYHPKNDGSRVAFFTDDDEAPSTPKADALFIPRENPRALVIRPIEHWPPKSSMKEACVVVHENGKPSEDDEHPPNGFHAAAKDNLGTENGSVKERGHPIKTSQKPNGGTSDDSMNHKGDSYITLSGHRAGEAAIVYEHGADIEAMMPKLRHSDYYTEPRIQELAAKERAEPGFCRRVKDFVVGRHAFGSIKFLGETDVRRLDLESLVQFNNREVIVYMDDTKKPPVGQGLNKPAEVNLLNIKCYDKKTGNQILEGPRIEKYKEMLKKKAEDQGAEFLSYDPVKGEWKFRVSHFSKYMLCEDQWDVDDDDDDDDDDEAASC